ncbi:MAG: hypothetical protein PHQ59_02520 [Candidatus Daviesbacteria bacterium]|nr:hypothetical protein [Candidatus Daviesbacteria bacterium]
MKKVFNKVRSFLIQDIQKYKFHYFLVAGLLVCAFVLRVWRIDQLLGFYFDQGRDALVVNEIIQGNLTLIGPTTAIEGIFLGPFYYYILAVGYLIGQGSPVIASYWQTIIILLGYFVTFLIARIYFSLRVGLITLFLMTFSFSQIKLDRWLSNPTPTMLFSPLVVLSLLLSFKTPRIFLPLTAFFSGILLQLEASSSFALMLITLIFIFVFRKKFTLTSMLLSALAFFITLLPQILFEIKHNFLITKSFLSFLSGKVQTEGQSTFRIPIDLTFQNRVDLYSITFLEKLKLNYDLTFSFVFVIFLIVSLFFVIKNWSNPAIKLIAFWFYGLLLFFLFYSGNYGIINNYYFFPIFPLFFILIALILNWMFKNRFLKPIVIILLALFLYDQLPMSLSYISSGVDGHTTIALGNQAKAVEYIINDSGEQAYNWDAYVPPVIPYTYTYLFKYYGNRYNRMPSEQITDNLYTIHEVDISIPERESAWLKRQDEIGTIIDTKNFGGITVEKRQRIK